MLKGYKKSYLVINIILAIVVVFFGINLLFYKQSGYLLCIIGILVPLSIITIIYGYENKKRRYMYELILSVFSYCLLFLLVTYILGIFVGFEQNVYRLNFSNLVDNIIPYSILILLSELFRYEITRKGDGSALSFVQVTIILILVDLTLFLNTYNLNSGDAQIKYVCSIMLPSVFKNIILLYFTKNGGFIPSLIYRLLLDLKLVVLPIMPKFGLYLDCTLNCILPVLICGLVELNLKKFRDIEIKPTSVKSKSIYKYLSLIVIASLTLGINLLSSGKFKYNMISIGSESMTPNINKGDAIIYEKIDKNLYPEVGQIIAFKKEGKVIVHRIIEIVNIGNNEQVYYTKGDFNDAPDGYPIIRTDILGVVRKKIRYIGIPSVLLYESLKNN